MTVTRRELFLALLVIGLGLLVWYLLPSEEDRILERLELAARALEAEDARGVMSVIDVERFSAPYDQYGAADIRQGLETAFEMFDNIEVVLESPSIRLEEGKRLARVSLRYAITGIYEGQFGFIIGTPTETAMARLTMEKNPQSGWQVVELAAATLPGI